MSETVTITVPDVGFEDSEIRVGLWFFQTGDEVGLGDRVVELLSAGILVPVVTTSSGTLSEVAARSDSRVRVGQTLGVLTVHQTDV